jgi:phosphoglycerate dehydrogenase-like enzyme
MLLWGLHRWGDLDQAARKGEWARGALPELSPRLLGECRVGLVGLGVIGTEVARVLGLLGVEVWGCDPAGVPTGVRSASLTEMLTECAALSLHCDLNPTTLGLVSAGELAICDPELVLVNTARGGLLDTEAAIQNLRSGRLGALCLDVFAQEPFADMRAVENLPRLLLHPHSAGYHRNLPRAVREGLLDTVRAFRAGQPVPHQVIAPHRKDDGSISEPL